MKAHDRERMVVNDEAAEWWSRMRLSRPDAAERAAFERWHGEHPEHRAAFERAEQAWQALGEIGEVPQAREMLEEAAEVAASAGAVRRSRLNKYALPVAAALAAMLLIALVPFAGRFLSADAYVTEVAQVREVRLPDGSRLTLGARSRVTLAFTAAERRVQLTSGEAFFDVRKDPARPFAVEVGQVQVRVLGTRFDVRRGAEQVSVGVLEGAVEVRQQAREPHQLRANQRAVIRAMEPVAIQSVPSTSPSGAWRNGRLSYDGVPLAEVVADVNRYYAAGIELASGDLADLKVTTSFHISQIDLMLNSLTVALPIVAERADGGHVVLARKPVER